MKKRLLTKTGLMLAALSMGFSLIGCGTGNNQNGSTEASGSESTENSGIENDSGTENNTEENPSGTENTPSDSTEDSSAADSSSSDVTDPDSTPTPTPDPDEPTGDPEKDWRYHIVQSGYYNAMAKWDENGNLLEEPAYTEGELIYYNDCDEYYDNFVARSNVFERAQMTLDDYYAHSSDNSMKISGRVQESFCFSGFAFKLSSDNVLDLQKLQGCEVTLGFWIYYTDDFESSVEKELTFGIWSNLNPEYDRENELKTPEPEYIELTPEMYAEKTPEEIDAINEENRMAKNKHDRIAYEEQSANYKGFFKLKEYTIPFETWKYVEVTTKINTYSADPMFAVATVGEGNSDNVTYYNPFYIDDITLRLDKLPEAESTEDSEPAIG